MPLDRIIVPLFFFSLLLPCQEVDLLPLTQVAAKIYFTGLVNKVSDGLEYKSKQAVLSHITEGHYYMHSYVNICAHTNHISHTTYFPKHCFCNTAIEGLIMGMSR